MEIAELSKSGIIFRQVIGFSNRDEQKRFAVLNRSRRRFRA